VSALRQNPEGRQSSVGRQSFLLLGLVALCSVAVEAQSTHGPGFDPAPVKIASRPIRKTRPITPMDLLALREPEGLSISPDGKYVAFVVGQAVYETNSYRSAVYIVSTRPDSAPRNLGSAGMPYWDEINQWVPEAPQWSRDSLSFTCRMRKRSRDHWQVWKWSIEARSWRQVTHSRTDVERYEWLPNQRGLFLEIALNDEAPAFAQGIVYDGKFQPWESVPIVEAVRRASPVRKEYRIFDFRTNRERAAKPDEVWRFLRGAEMQLERAGGKTTTVMGGDINTAKTSPDHRSVAYLYTIRDASVSRFKKQRIFIQRENSEERTYLQMDSSFIDEFWWSSDSETIYYTERRGNGHSMRLMVASAASGVSKPVFAAPSSDYFSEFSLDAKGVRIACLRERNTLPPEIVVIDASTKVIRPLVNLNPEFGAIRVSSATRIEGINSYGDPWFGYLVRPLDYVEGKKYPLVITTYRCGDYFLGGATGNESPIQVYAANGFAVLCFDVGPPRNIAPGDYETKLLDWASPTASMEMAAAELIGQGLVDPERVGITGFSHGAEIVGYAVTHSNLFHAVIGAGGYDPYFYFIGGNAWHQIFGRWGLGGWPEGNTKPRWQEIAMSLRADLVQSPVLENIADSEYIAYLPRVVSLQELGKPVELHIYPYELHVKNQPRHRYEIYVRNLNWFRFWLQDETQFEPGQMDEIKRWQKLRTGSGPRDRSRLE